MVLVDIYRKKMDLTYQEVKKVLQMPEVTSVAAEYVELDHIINF